MKWTQSFDLDNVVILDSWRWSANLLTVALICLLLVTIILVYLQQMKDHIPGPTSLPLIGSLYLFRSERQLHVACNKLCKLFGPIFRLQLGSINAVVVTNAKLISEVQRKQELSGRASTMGFTRLINNGGKDIAFSDVSSGWKFHRKFVHANMFQRRHLQQAESYILTEADVLCRDFLQYADSRKPIDCKWNLIVAVTNVVFTTLFGKRFTYDDPKLVEWTNGSELLLKSLSSGGLLHCMPWLRGLPGFSQKWNQVVKCQENNWNLMGQFLKEKLDSNSHDELNNTPLAARMVSAAMQQMENADYESFLKVTYRESLNSDNDPTETLQPAQIRSILMDLLGAGSDTTTHTMRWLVALLVKHSDIQERVFTELDEAITGELTAAHRSVTPFLDAVIQETLRLYPAAPLSVPHSATTNTSLGSYSIPKDTVVLLNLYGMMRDPNVWVKPDTFDPDRFLSTDSIQKKLQQQHFMPFSAGVRACMGKHLAQMTLYLLAAKLFKTYRMEEVLEEPLDLEPQEDGEAPVAKPYRILISKRCSSENKVAS
ncbi:steroid 17-alpha-hydroxylase/17,20 lyase-like [Corticium candelabrum]|uniref:steroid 17-alpha-hydroxylase/17,20 lyase-like n=1 Tax=Corticium candelabrum TaxID=121492 RepID=UPI002E3800DA|nr:steroid 17-alpha-hydroxylase/17,20 lyase-like [Corticium candelabrum]